MNNDVYQATQNMVTNMAVLILDLPLDEMLDAIIRAETLGSILDPSLYMAGAKPMSAFKEVLGGAIKFQRAARKHATREAKHA